MIAVQGWGCAISDQISRLCAVINRSNGTFVSACNGRWPSSGADAAWRWFEGVDSPVLDRRCAACAAYVLEHCRSELTPGIAEMLEAERGPVVARTMARDVSAVVAFDVSDEASPFLNNGLRSVEHEHGGEG